MNSDMIWYQALLHDHYHHPRNKGVIATPSLESQQYNPSCGDSIAITGIIEGSVIQKLMFTGSGCIISQATASLLTEDLVGKSTEAILAYDKDYMLTLIGIALGPVRLKCALLPLEAIKEAVRDYQQKQENSHVEPSSSDAGAS